MRGATKQVKCGCGCGVVFTARVADINRGWGKYATKSCKAIVQMRKKGRNPSNPTRHFPEPKYHEEHDPSDDEYWLGKDY